MLAAVYWPVSRAFSGFTRWAGSRHPPRPATPPGRRGKRPGSLTAPTTISTRLAAPDQLRSVAGGDAVAHRQRRHDAGHDGGAVDLRASCASWVGYVRRGAAVRRGTAGAQSLGAQLRAALSGRRNRREVSGLQLRDELSAATRVPLYGRGFRLRYRRALRTGHRHRPARGAHRPL